MRSNDKEKHARLAVDQLTNTSSAGILGCRVYCDGHWVLQYAMFYARTFQICPVVWSIFFLFLVAVDDLNSPLSVVSVNQGRPHVQTVHNVHVKGFSETTKTTTIDLANKFLKPLTQPISHEKVTISQKTSNQWEEISIVSEPTWGEGYSEQWRRGWSFAITSVKLGSKAELNRTMCIHI